MKARDYTILERAVGEGIMIGWRQAYKHVEEPAVEDIWECLTQGIMSAIDEVFTFEDSNGDE